MKKFPDRQKEKQDSREEDIRRLLEGEISPSDLRKENGFASCLPLQLFKIVAIGNKKLIDLK